MASKFNALLNQIGNGFLRPKGQMGDWQHAARVFGDDNYALAPKAKFLYHVYFDINSSAVLLPQLKQRHRDQIGLLVKSVDLPRFNIRTQTLNQYNRKKVIQTTHEYTPMTFRFHDDRSHIVNMLWQSYYKYYYADSLTAGQRNQQAYSRSAYKSYDYIRGPHGYDNNSTIPFFNKITLYQLSNRQYVSYTLINPLISQFNHDTVTSSDQGTVGAECTMVVNFEAVTYDAGMISSGEVNGFATTHYDKSPSPISAAGGGTGSLLGVGGVLDGAASVLGALSKGSGPGGAFNSLENLVNTAATAVNTYNNTKRLSKAGVKQEAIGLAAGATVLAAGAAIGGIKNTFFSVNNNSNKTQSTQRNDLIGGGP